MNAKCLILLMATSVMGVRGETILTKEFAESIVDIAWKKYEAFVESKPNPGKSDTLLKCVGVGSAFVCEVNTEYVLPDSLSAGMMTYFRAMVNLKYLAGDRVLTSKDGRVSMFLQRVGGANFSMFIPIKKESTSMNILNLLASLIE